MTELANSVKEVANSNIQLVNGFTLSPMHSVHGDGEEGFNSITGYSF